MKFTFTVQFIISIQNWLLQKNIKGHCLICSCTIFASISVFGDWTPEDRNNYTILVIVVLSHTNHN